MYCVYILCLFHVVIMVFLVLLSCFFIHFSTTATEQSKPEKKTSKTISAFMIFEQALV